MDFGLGLVLSFTDNATAGINNAVNSLNQLTQTAEGASQSLNQMASLSALSVVTDKLGSSFINAGQNIISTLGQVINTVNETGRTLMYAENQLNALYANSGKTGKQVIGQIQQYAKESMFDFEQLIPAVTSLKSVGIEAFDAITSSTGEAKYSLLDYASGLASFAPQMKNAYGTGVNAAIGAMREYIAEGNAMSLKRGAGLDITGILGEDKGATIEERTRQVADLIEHLNMMDMVDAMKNSPMVKLSNMGDTLFQLKGMISDSDIGGLSNSINSIIDIFYNFVDSIDESRLETIAKNIGSALSSIMKPVEWLSKKIVALADGIVRLVENNPAIAKMIIIGGALVGALLVLAGIALKITSALSGLSLMLLVSGNSFKTLGGLMRTGLLKVMSVLLPFIALMGMMRFVWKNDIAGIKTAVTGFVSNLRTSFDTARDAVDGSVGHLIRKFQELDSRDDFFSNLTVGIMKVMMLFRALKDAWGDNTLSEENFLKAKELGILPLIEAILDLKYRFGFFKKGFIDGWKEVGKVVSDIFSGFKDAIKGTFLEDMLDGLTVLLEKLSNNDPQAWYDLGKAVAELAGGILLLVGYFKLMSGVISIVSTVIGVFSKLWGIIKTVGSAISAVWNFITPFVGGLMIAFGGLLVSAKSFADMWVNGFNKVKAILTVVGGALAGLGLVIAGIASWPAIIVGAIAGAIGVLVVFIKDNWNSIVNFFKEIGVVIGDFLRSFWEGLKADWETITDMLTESLKNAVQFILDFVGGLINGVIWAINGAIGLINMIPGVSIDKIPSLEIPQLAMGGVVSQPTQAIIGEAGTEAVVPLENNLGWLSKLANMIVTEMHSITPTNSNHISPSNNGGSSSYMTTSNNNTQTIQGDTDNSVVFNEGAIQVIVQNATEEEAMNLARKVMEYIKRQKELDAMVRYA